MAFRENYLQVRASIDLRPLTSGLKGARNTIAAKVEKALSYTGNYLLTKSREVVPIDTKRLFNSGQSKKTSGNGLTSVITVSYGDPGVNYAVYVHEDLTVRHGASYNARYVSQIAAGITHSRRPEERAKFLEYTINQEKTRLINVFVAGMS